MSDQRTIIAVMRPDWVEPYAKLGHKIPVVIESTHPRFVVDTRLDYGFVQVALRDGYNVEIRQPATAGASVPPQLIEKERDDTRVDSVPSDLPMGSTASTNGVTCAFCGRDEASIPFIIQSSRATICAACVNVCVQIGLQPMIEEWSGWKRRRYVFTTVTEDPQAADAVDPVGEEGQGGPRA